MYFVGFFNSQTMNLQLKLFNAIIIEADQRASDCLWRAAFSD